MFPFFDFPRLGEKGANPNAKLVSSLERRREGGDNYPQKPNLLPLNWCRRQHARVSRGPGETSEETWRTRSLNETSSAETNTVKPQSCTAEIRHVVGGVSYRRAKGPQKQVNLQKGTAAREPTDENELPNPSPYPGHFQTSTFPPLQLLPPDSEGRDRHLWQKANQTFAPRFARS